MGTGSCIKGYYFFKMDDGTALQRKWNLQEQEGPAIAKRLLADLYFEEQVSERIQYLIAHHHTYDDVEGIDYQILVEVDFLVNLYEDEASNEAIERAYQKIFRTDSGRKICREMFHLNVD